MRCLKNIPRSTDGVGSEVWGEFLGKSRAAKRHKWRLPCEIVYEGGRQRSFVLDLSETGLFVQASGRLRPGTEIEVRLTLEHAAAPLVLRAHVVRAKQVPAQLISVVHGGIGLALHSPPKEYLDALAALEEDGAHLRAQATPEKPPAPALVQRFCVRVKQCDGQRSRTLTLHADTAEQARSLALRETGAGWEVASVEPVAR